MIYNYRHERFYCYSTSIEHDVCFNAAMNQESFTWSIGILTQERDSSKSCDYVFFNLRNTFHVSDSSAYHLGQKSKQ